MKQHKHRPLKGVNLGGWLVLERWMTPSVFKGHVATNEYGLSQSRAGKAAIRRHHQHFITEADIDWLAEHDIAIVRVPIGHWLFGDAQHYVDSSERLNWLFEQTQKRGIKVLLDLHGAPGAQNRFNHSGSGNVSYRTDWLKRVDYQAATIQTLQRIAREFGHYSNLWGVELLNEPSVGFTGWRLSWFYRRAYQAIAPLLPLQVRIIFSDGYAPLLLTNTFGWPFRTTHRVVMDSHFYHCFGQRNKRRTMADHIKVVRRNRLLIRLLEWFQPLIIGEWSTALPYKVGDTNIKRLEAAQLEAYSSVEATFYWNYKTEGGGRWSYRHMVEKGILL